MELGKLINHGSERGVNGDEEQHSQSSSRIHQTMDTMYSITKERAGVDVVAVKNDLNVKV